ncbi:hypothetical protein CTAYLR_008003 [Chrysophaeum taylorii]|uniref:Inosine/uridine-preferring nucleoside hydrolase domain-containing protein n=1 Tax=Chrysophaeum taylorii TaxID=2483200 RepID=A0AAD7U6Y8_9STRA|nr:hypothetical protein CTAYLR_008003 [Chrysophaeum taylorii]
MRLWFFGALASFEEEKVRRVWVDLDNSAGVEGVRDVDDALALIQILHSPEVRVVGVSTVFGNAAEAEVYEATRSFLDAHFSGVPLFRSIDASAVANTTIIALGPLTNVAEVLKRALPEEIVFVGGRRPGHRFTVGNANADALADMNFEKDPVAAASVLESGVRVVLAPFELSEQVRLGAFGRGGGPLATWVAEVTDPWLEFWVSAFSVDYFNPYDCLAVVAITHPHLLRCDQRRATIEEGPSDGVSLAFSNHAESPAAHGIGTPTKPYLHVRPRGDGAPVTFCHAPVNAAEVTSLILDRIILGVEEEDPRPSRELL